MSFRVPGKLIKRNVRLGDAVKEGQVLAQLDPVDAQKQFASAKAALDAAEHRLMYAQQQLDRDKAQSEANLIATNQLEQTQDSYIAALAGRDQASAQLVVTRNNLQYNTLVADHDGLITSENADTGQVVSAGQAVYGLAWNGDTDVILDAAESELGRIAIGQFAKVTFPALPGRQFEARVREIAPAADAQSRTFRVKLQMTGSLDAVRLGMTGDATLLPIAAGMAATTGGSNTGSGANTTDSANVAIGAAATRRSGTAGQHAAAVPANAAANGASANTSASANHSGLVNTSASANHSGLVNTSASTTHGGSVNAPTDGAANATPPVAAATTFTLPATAIFHQDSTPAVWVIAGNESTLQLRAVKVSSYTDHSTVVTSGLNDGDVVVLAGVHTVYAGQHVKPVRPLFDGEGNIEGPAPAAPANGAAAAPAARNTASTQAPAAPAPAAQRANVPQVSAAASGRRMVNIPQVASAQPNAGAR
jgi:multidrug efflux pump subunit AcrA (membrane-fusion protein)